MMPPNWLLLLCTLIGALWLIDALQDHPDFKEALGMVLGVFLVLSAFIFRLG